MGWQFPSVPRRNIELCNVSITTEGENKKLLHGSMAWLDSEPLGQRSYTVSNNLPSPPCLIFPAEPSESYCSCSCNAQIPETLGLTPVDLLQPPSFCKTLSGTLISLGCIIDVSKQNHQQRPSFSGCHPLLQQQETKWTSLGFREGAEPISCLTLSWGCKAEQPCPFLHTHQGVGAVGMKHLCGSEKPSSWQRVPLLAWHPNVFPTPASLPARLHLPSCHFVTCLLIPSCAAAPPSTITQWSSPQIADSLCLQKHAPSLGGGRGEVFRSVPNTHALQLWLFSLQGCHGSKESSLNPQSSYWLRQHSLRALSPAVALCPSPCAHTHFPLHTDAAQLTRGQAAGVSKLPKGRPGRKQTQSRQLFALGQAAPSGLSIPLSKEQHCLTRCLHRSTSHYLSDGVIAGTNLYLQHFTSPLLFQSNFQSPTVFTFPCLSLGELCNLLKPTSPFLKLQVPVGLSKMEKASFLLLFHQRAVKRFTVWSFASLLSPQKMALEFFQGWRQMLQLGPLER